MAELVDATDSKSVGHCGCVGSSPTPGTAYLYRICISRLIVDLADPEDNCSLRSPHSIYGRANVGVLNSFQLENFLYIRLPG